MNLAGFDLLAGNSRGLEQAGHPRIEVPSAALIAMLKMSAWLDRPQERMRDLHDLAYLFDHYLDPMDDRLFLGEAANLDLFDERANIYLLGFDIGRLSAPSPTGAPERFLRRVRAHVPSQVALVRRWRTVQDEEGVLKRLELLERGWSDGFEV